MNKNTSKLAEKLLIFFILTAFSMSLAGCEPFRKKFIRQKKEDKAAEVAPILEPIEYPAKGETSKDRYAMCYSLWKVWHKELLFSLDEDKNDKRHDYMLAQLTTQMQGMKDNLTGDKVELIGGLLAKLGQVKSELGQPEGIRNMYSIKSNLEEIGKKVRDLLNPKLALQYK